jgi:ribose transport system substrate-binding protein
MQQILTYYLNYLDVVFCENDRMALGAAQAIYEAGKKVQILVIGFDGIPSAIMVIQQGYMQGTIAQQLFEMGKLGVAVANSILKGETIIFDDVETKELFVGSRYQSTLFRQTVIINCKQ